MQFLELYNIFLQKIDELKKYLIQNPEFSFQRWLQDLQNNGLSYQSELQSPRIKNQEWQKSWGGGLALAMRDR